MSNEQDVREKRLNAMKFKILKAEQENLRLARKLRNRWSKRFDESSMTKQRRTIEVTIC